MFIPPYKLLNKAAAWVGIQRRLEHAFPSSEELDAYRALAPSITIARDPGSGGNPIAHSVAERLGMKIYDDALIEAIAKSAKKRKEVISAVDERTRNLMEDTIHSLFNPDYISDVTYFQHLVRSTLAVAHEGNAVILGRGANHILSPHDTLNVLVTAPYAVRVARAIQYEGISSDEAKKRIAKISTERREFVSEYFHKSYSQALSYDVIINTEYLDIDSSSRIIIKAFRNKFPNWREKIARVIRT